MKLLSLRVGRPMYTSVHIIYQVCDAGNACSQHKELEVTTEHAVMSSGMCGMPHITEYVYLH